MCSSSFHQLASAIFGSSIFIPHGAVHGVLMEDKRRRVAKLCSVSGVTDSAVFNILKQLRGQQVPKATKSFCREAALCEYDNDVALQLKLPLLAGGFFRLGHM